MELFSFNTDVSDLILKKNYSRAAKVLKARLEKEPGKASASVRQQLADVLVLDGKKAEALPILESLADEYAREGFVAKAIAVFKKIQRLDPSKVSIDEKLAHLFKERDEQTSSRFIHRRPIAPPSEEPAPPPPARDNATPPSGSRSVASRHAPEPEPAAEPFIIEFGGHEMVVDETPTRPVPASAPTLPLMRSAPKLVAPEPEPEQISFDTMEVPQQVPSISGGLAKTPLFSDFNTEELIAVIKGLNLLTFEPGDIVVSEGESGHSLFVVSTGIVKAFVRDASGHAHAIRLMQDGDFFGEMALLTGRPRTATVTAASPCELLELDSEVVRQITATYPRVNNVLRAFCEIRMRNPAENLIRRQGAEYSG